MQKVMNNEEKILDLWRKGYSEVEIADKMDMLTGTVMHILENYGVL